MKLKTLAIAAICLATQACVALDTDLGEENLLSEGSGQLSLEWSIVSDGVLLSCVDAGAAEVEVAVLGELEIRERTSCFGGFAVVDTLAQGEHLVEVSLVSPEGELLVTADLGAVEIVSGATVPLGAVELSL